MSTYNFSVCILLGFMIRLPTCTVPYITYKQSKISCIYCKVLKKYRFVPAHVFVIRYHFQAVLLRQFSLERLKISWGPVEDVVRTSLKSGCKQSKNEWCRPGQTGCSRASFLLKLSSDKSCSFAHMLSCSTACFKNRHLIDLLVDSMVENWPVSLECWPGHKIDPEIFRQPGGNCMC